MNICIIGGSGFVGTRLISLIQKGNTILNLDKAPSAEHGGLTQIGDVRERASLAAQLTGQEAVVLLAAEHRDDVTPTSLYYDVNVQGMRNVLSAMEANGITNIVFTSSVAIYGMNHANPPTENSPANYFNDYGRTKWGAEEVLKEWVAKGEGRNALVVRPTVIFGENNRGNVFNLLQQIQSGKFLMIGNGKNCKSMAYVGNIVAFIDHMIKRGFSGYEVYNYVDKPDLSMNELVRIVYKFNGKKLPRLRLPYFVGYIAGKVFDGLTLITGKKLPISSIRIKKFCSSTVFDASKIESTGFIRPFTLEEGLKRTLKSEFGDGNR